jgi:hypothetical protein
MTAIARIVSAIVALGLTTYFVIKGVALRIPVTRLDQGLVFLGLALAIVHAVLHWRAEKQKRRQDLPPIPPSALRR